MKRDISYTILQRLISMVLCLGIVLSSSAETDLFDIFSGLNIYAEAADEMPKDNEYDNETLEAMFADTTYPNAARSCYTCATDAKYVKDANSFASFGGVKKRTIFHVFAFEGDTICIGSSVCNSGLTLDHRLDDKLTVAANKDSAHFPDEDSIDVVMTDLHGNNIPIDIRANDTNKTGYIASPDVEHAAVLMEKQSDGTYKGILTDNTGAVKATYTPYTYKVTETGVYTFEFHSYDKTGTVQIGLRSEQWATYETNYYDATYGDCGGMIAALNLTVFDENGEKQTGRAYADFLSLQMGTKTKGSTNQGVHEAYYILTTDSYIYKMKFNGVAPYTYNFFSNNRGIYDDNGKIIYKSVKDISNNNSFARMGSLFRYPGTGDTEFFKSFYIFLEYPDPKLEGYLFEKAVPPDPAKNVRFVSTVEVDNEEVLGAYEGMGGYFEFDVDEATTATLRLEFKNTSKFGGKEYAPVEISTTVTPHTTNRVYWNGRDGNGEIIPVGEYSMEDIVFTVTTKAGEIHFPIFDMENAKGGITFTRLSHIYDKDGKWLDKSGTIYEKTKNVIYYDETAIYYGEKISPEAENSEAQVTGTDDTKQNSWAIDRFFSTHSGDDDYWPYRNMDPSNGGEGISRNLPYIKNHPKIRVGDHSHTTNVIEYFDEKGNLRTDDDQADMIAYLDSASNPVGKSSGSGKEKELTEYPYNAPTLGNMTTTDYAIANYWTFIPSKPAVSPAGSTETIKIIDPDESLFNLTGRVFYDSSTDDTVDKANGIFDDGTDSGEYLIPGVTLNLYRKLESTANYDSKKTYVAYDAAENSLTPITSGSDFTSHSINNIYELVETGQTTSDGIYTFTGLKYDSSGTEYIYQVEKPSDSYALTSKTKGKPTVKTADNNANKFGYYANKSYLDSWKGTEIQHIKVGGTDGVDPTKYGYDSTKEKPDGNVTVAAVDVGYTYVTMSKSLKVKKLWENGAKTQPTSVVYAISYSIQDKNDTPVYDYWTLSPIQGWMRDESWLPAKQDGRNVDNYYVSAEYYVANVDGKYNIYKHTFDYTNGKYETFVGKAYRLKEPSEYLNTTDGSIKDVNKDGIIDAKDYGEIPSRAWEEIDVEEAPFRAVLDRSDSSDKIDVNITNSAESGTVQIFKHFDDPFTTNALQGATFRIYKGDIEKIKGLVDKGDADSIAELTSLQVGSSTSRDNGLLAFPNLDPTETYTVREMSPPGGYRMLQEYYQVVPAGEKGTVKDEYKDYTVEFGNNVTIDNEVEKGEEGVAKLLIGNALADSNFFIRKRILGRAWQDEEDDIPKDSFKFIIENDFSTTGVGLTGSTGITVDTEEIGRQINETSVTEPDLIQKLQDFSNAVNGLNTLDPVTIDYDSDYYTTDVTSGDLTYKISTDEKVSKGLIVAGDEDTPAAFRGKEFPMAGTYTFTIKEDIPSDTGTLQYSKRTYTVEVTVTRKLKDETNTDPITLDNSYLEAAVSKITYTDDDVSSAAFASNSPSFTNTYAPAPAKQETTYAISKEFTGRGTSKKEWLGTDEFTINIEGVDSTTQNAIQNGNISIEGLESYLNGEVNKWQYKFKKDDTVPFTSFTFKDIEFPVKFIGKDGNEWTPKEGEKEPPSDVTARTMPVEYWLRIYEEIPSDTNGITYDTTNYYLHIILRNTFKGQESTDSEEEDGIIDEIDMYLFEQDGETNLEELQKLNTTDARASCLTKQKVLSSEDWFKNDPAPDGGAYTWWYIEKNTGILQGPITNHNAVPSNADPDLLIRKWEKHDNPENHTMPFNNEYKAAVYSWAPKVTKTLEGRNWDANDKFTFTIKCTSSNAANVTLPEPPSITIDSKTDGYTKPFDKITFNEPGDYTFTITEEHSGGGSIKVTDGTYTIEVTIEDNGKGQLIAKFNGSYDSNTPINFTNVYTDTANSFKFDISKTIIGRNWKADDSFTFTITPEDVETKNAINGGLLTVPTGPTGWIGNSTDGYTAKLEGSEAGTSVDVFQKYLGDITAVGLPPDKNEAKYTFSITETAVANMKCREPTIELTINVSRERDSSGVLTGELEVTATYAYMGEHRGDLSGTDPTVDIPFENVCMSSLTVEKEVVSTSEHDTQSFDFTVEFEFDTLQILETECAIKSESSDVALTGIIPTKSDNKWTYTFSLSDGKSVKFTDIPAYTKYTISEENKSTNYMFLRAIDEDGKMLTTTTTGDTSSTDQITINVEKPPTVIFVNGRMINLPAAGGVGINTILLLGLIIAAAATGTLIILRCKSGRSRDNPNG